MEKKINIDFQFALNARKFANKYSRAMHSIAFNYQLNFSSNGYSDLVLFDTTFLKRRRDYQNIFNCFRETLLGQTRCSIVQVSYSFDILYLFKNIWNLLAEHNLSDFYKKSQLFQLNALVEKLEKIEIECSGIVTFCDAHPEDNVIAQYGKHLGVKTFTLQHGFYPSVKTSVNSLISQNFVSDYVLAWGGASSRNLAKILKCQRCVIDYGYYRPYLEISNKVDQKFDVIIFFDGKSQRSNNIILTNLYYTLVDLNYNVVVKLHPDDYNVYGLPRDSIVDGIFGDLCSFSQIAVLASSGIFVDLILNRFPFVMLKNDALPKEINEAYYVMDKTQIFDLFCCPEHLLAYRSIVESSSDEMVVQKRMDYSWLGLLQ